MTNQQIITTLKNTGFQTELLTDCVMVSLNRKVNTMEVEAALKFEVPIEMIIRSGKSVIVHGIDT